MTFDEYIKQVEDAEARMMQANDIAAQMNLQYYAAEKALETSEYGTDEWHKATDQLEIETSQVELMRDRLESLIEETERKVADLKRYVATKT